MEVKEEIQLKQTMKELGVIPTKYNTKSIESNIEIESINSFRPRRFSVNSHIFFKKNADANPTHLVPLESPWSQLQIAIKKPQIFYPWEV
jgi:hypothetical protein